MRPAFRWILAAAVVGMFGCRPQPADVPQTGSSASPAVTPSGTADADAYRRRAEELSEELRRMREALTPADSAGRGSGDDAGTIHRPPIVPLERNRSAE